MANNLKRNQTPVPSSDTFILTLSKAYEGTPVLPNAKCEFSYNWDFDRNMGLAYLTSINGTKVDITLHPLGILGMLGFMSNIEPTTVEIDGKKIVIFRVIMDIYLRNNERVAAIMFNEDGSCTETTENWDSNAASGLIK
ncbi:MAG: hypothetical protein LBQ22_01740 [Bacteroidales bacterium]|jgi:hypothetical protein|nr:hypothetical protein [Bacteroidales bacterium]